MSYSCPIYITGDFNVHMEDKSDSFSGELCEIFDTFRLTQHVVEPTHELGGTLDLFVINDDMDICDLLVTDVRISDHFLLTCSLNMSTASPEFITRTTRNWCDFDDNLFRADVCSTIGIHNASSWDNMSLDELVDIFNDTITVTLDQLVPQRTKLFRSRPSNVWFDSECRAAKRLTRLKERQYRRTRESADQTNWIMQLRSYH